MSELSYAAHAEARREKLVDNAARHRQRRIVLARRGGIRLRAARVLRALAGRLEQRATTSGGPAVRSRRPQPVGTFPGGRG